MKNFVRNIADTLFPGLARRRYFKHIESKSSQVFNDKAEKELYVLKTLIDPDKAFFDVGANSGDYVYQAMKYMPARKIFAFEPQPKYVSHLKRLFPKVSVNQIALSSESGEKSFKIPLIDGKEYPTRGTLESFLEENETGSRKETVKIVSLDSIKEELKAGKVGCIKIDVEGHELNVLKGSINTLKNDRPNLIVEIEQRHHGEPIQYIFDWILNIGYDAYYLDAEEFKLKPVENVTNVPGPVRNFIFLPK